MKRWMPDCDCLIKRLTEWLTDWLIKRSVIILFDHLISPWIPFLLLLLLLVVKWMNERKIKWIGLLIIWTWYGMHSFHWIVLDWFVVVQQYGIWILIVIVLWFSLCRCCYCYNFFNSAGASFSLSSCHVFNIWLLFIVIIVVVEAYFLFLSNVRASVCILKGLI